MSSVWDDPSMQVSGDYIKFEKVGDSVAGTIIEVSAKRWEDGSISPQLLLDTADGSKTVTAGQVRLKAALAEQRPERGDHITITLSDIERRSGGKTLKHFDVKVTRAGSTPAPAAAGSTMDIEEAKRLLGAL
jgi:hypothetical protein